LRDAKQQLSLNASYKGTFTTLSANGNGRQRLCFAAKQRLTLIQVDGANGAEPL
jgi:hypothetical protein